MSLVGKEFKYIMRIEELMRAHPAHPGCDKHGEGLSGDGVVYVEGKALILPEGVPRARGAGWLGKSRASSSALLSRA